MSLGRERSFFAGANTPDGFVNFFSDITAEDENEVYILKGGPGTGKSRMMKTIAKAAVIEGYDVELIKCSSDADSLDGVRIPELKKTMLDGTAPHIVDMSLPGARDHIVNLGDFWNEELLKQNRDTIRSLSEQKTANYCRVYKYLKAAKEIQNNIDEVAHKALAFGKLNIFIQSLVEHFFQDTDIACKTGKERRIFGTALTPKGPVSTLPTLFRGLKVYALRCEYGRAASYVIEALQREAIQRGFYVESIKCPFAPDRTEHLIVPQLSLAFTTYNRYHSAMDCEVFGEYLLDAYYNDLITERYTKDMEYDVFRVQELLDKSQRYLEKSMNVHKSIERIFIDSMDFEAVTQCTENIIDAMLR